LIEGSGAAGWLAAGSKAASEAELRGTVPFVGASTDTVDSAP